MVKLTEEFAQEAEQVDMEEQKKTGLEVSIALQDKALEQGILNFGHLSPYACPECHGVLSVIKDGDIIRYRCHTGHAYSADSLLTSITENIEKSLWEVIRGVEESIILLNNLGDQYAEKNQPKLAALYFKKVQEAEARAHIVRQAVQSHEQLNNSSISQQADEAEENN